MKENLEIRINGPYYLNVLFGCKESTKKETQNKTKQKEKPIKC